MYICKCGREVNKNNKIVINFLLPINHPSRERCEGCKRQQEEQEYGETSSQNFHQNI